MGTPPDYWHGGVNSGPSVNEALNFTSLGWMRLSTRHERCVCSEEKVYVVPDFVRKDGLVVAKAFNGKRFFNAVLNLDIRNTQKKVVLKFNP